MFEDVLAFVGKYNSVLENNNMELLDEILDDIKSGHAKYTSRVLLYGKTQQME